MSRRCPHCDQLLMEDEAVCWDCGQPTGFVPAETAPTSAEEAGSDRPLSAVAIYTGLTVVVIAGALFLTALLGRQPRLQAAAVQRPDDWQQVTDEGETFTVFLPAGWHLVDSASEEGRATLDRLMAEDAFRDTLQPWYQVRDVETIFLAASATPDAADPPDETLLVARSAVLNRLTYFELLSVVEQTDVIISAAEVVDDFDRRYAYVQLRTPAGLFCQQQFILGDEELLLTAYCNRSEEPPTATPQIIRRSFQPLSD